MAVLAVADEIKPGVSAAIDHDPGRVDALFEPKLGQRLAELVGADGGEIGGVRAKPGRRDHGVRGVAAEPLDERGAVLRLVEFDQRFANREEIRQRPYLVATATAAPAMRPPAARLTNRIARVERRRARARFAANA